MVPISANTRTPEQLFAKPVRYVIPAFQRPYVWTQDDQWQPLWDDIQRVAAALVTHSEPTASVPDPANHFLGAVVVKAMATPEPGQPARYDVIDGQQRLVTLQLILDAAREVMKRNELAFLEAAFRKLVANEGPHREEIHRFKLTPSRVDHDGFVAAMEASDGGLLGGDRRHIVKARNFFVEAMTQWIDDDQVLPRIGAVKKLNDLASVLHKHLCVVEIELSENDEAQLIFETLNDRGTPLLASDLIKNFVFVQGESLGVDIDEWNEQFWGDFDDDWWRKEISQGRSFRSRIDVFLQYWLTMHMKTEIQPDRVFARFREYAGVHFADLSTALTFLEGFRREANIYRGFADPDAETRFKLDPTSAQGRFQAQVVEALELGAIVPLFLWLITSADSSERTQADRALEAVESWAVRRTVLRQSLMGVNRMVVEMLQHLSAHPMSEVGDRTVEYLTAKDAESRHWPTDDQLICDLPDIRLYGRVKGSRLVAILDRIESSLRSSLMEPLSSLKTLHIEHIMPQKWYRHWDPESIQDDAVRDRLDHVVHTVGNLTLVTRKLNNTLADRPWTDDDASAVAKSGRHQGLGKWSLLRQHSMLEMNRRLVDDHPDAWTEEDIKGRSREMAEAIAEVWPGPEAMAGGGA